MQEIKIVSRTIKRYYVNLIVEVESKRIIINFSLHAINRIKVWNLEEIEVVGCLIFPDEVVIGHSKRFIAHKIKGDKVIRIVYEYREGNPFVVTVYAPYKERYFKGGNFYADKIFS